MKIQQLQEARYVGHQYPEWVREAGMKQLNDPAADLDWEDRAITLSASEFPIALKQLTAVFGEPEIEKYNESPVSFHIWYKNGITIALDDGAPPELSVSLEDSKVIGRVLGHT